MYIEGNILYFTPFHFKGAKTQPKNKYFIVLKTIEDLTILVSLPSSQDHVPCEDEIEYGCIERPDKNFNCFVFSPDVIVTENNKSFPKKTFIYGAYLDTHNIPHLYNKYRIEGMDYEVFGKLLPNVYEELINCLKNSKAVNNKYRRMLS